MMQNQLKQVIRELIQEMTRSNDSYRVEMGVARATRKSWAMAKYAPTRKQDAFLKLVRDHLQKEVDLLRQIEKLWDF